MKTRTRLSVTLLLALWPAAAKTVVFWQPGFPAVDSRPVARETLRKALEGLDPSFVTLDELARPGTLGGGDLLVLPYGSAVPADAWKVITGHLRDGGSLLVLGGRPLAVPVRRQDGRFVTEQPQNRYSRHVGIWHAYDAPQKDFTRFVWGDDFSFFASVAIRARRAFAAGMGGGSGTYRGAGYFLNAAGNRIAAPVTVQDYLEPGHNWGSRMVFLNFEPAPGYWDSADGISLIRQAAAYAAHGATQFWIEVANPTVVEGEIPQAVVRLHNARMQRRGRPLAGKVTLELIANGETKAAAEISCTGELTAANVAFPGTFPPGLYTIRGDLREGGETREMYHTGVWLRDESILRSGALLKVQGDYFSLNGAPFIPFGTNYFSTDVYRTGYFTGGSLAGNAFLWERDFSEMAKHNVNFVRTGIWMNHDFYLDRVTGGAQERLLRALEAFLHSAGRHKIQVQFTFYAFDPQTIQRYPGQTSFKLGPGSNPYTDPAAIRAQKNFIQSIVTRFKDVPYLSWDLINEPSFSNPQRLWRGNTPKGDPSEFAAWNKWLEERYQTIDRLAKAWRVTPEELGGFGQIPLPGADDLTLQRYGNPRLARAVDYNLFAQHAFNRWAAELVGAIRAAGGKQLVTVGQDEGGVTNRLLNQFYGDSGVDFTVVHTWWRDDALLWDSLAAKRPDMPNLVGETGVQPVWAMDTSWRWDELRALGLLERKLALGLAGANAGSLHWDWSRSDYFGSQRRDGAHRNSLEVIGGMAAFAKKAAPHAAATVRPEIAIVLPQSLQLSVFNSYAVEAQQKCVRALYQYARAEAYAVGEYQLRLLGEPKLIIVPSPWILTEEAWEALLGQVRRGATLLISGRIDADEHFLPTGRAGALGLDYEPKLLDVRHYSIQWPGGHARLTYSGDKTTYLDRGSLASGATFVDKEIGQGRIWYFTLPLELNDDLEAIGRVYRSSIERAAAQPAYSTATADPGILICPTRWKDATLYVLTSESDSQKTVSFRDAASGKEFRTALEPGRAALLLVGRDGHVIADYNWR